MYSEANEYFITIEELKLVYSKSSSPPEDYDDDCALHYINIMQ
jgi:hypothetical protein